MDAEVHVPTMSAILAVGGLSNLLLALCMAHTWRYWRQVKWYIIMLIVGNFMDVAFTQGFGLAATVNSTWAWSTAGCRFVMFISRLGPSLSAMALAALALHVLLTSITGSQGNRLRHLLVLGLFVLLSFPLPLAKIPFSKAMSYDTGDGSRISFCSHTAGSHEAMLQLEIGESVALLFFPLFIILLCVVATGILYCTASRASTKGDEDKSDLILAGVLGAMLLVFCTPYYIFYLVFLDAGPVLSAAYSIEIFKTLFALQHLMNCFPIAAAVVTIIFAYVHAFRNRGEFSLSGESATTSGERQKLVN